jgi:gamma-glutamylcyclotransferase (GGCT)/AIG2-like uncharacterized protein YtfP
MAHPLDTVSVSKELKRRTGSALVDLCYSEDAAYICKKYDFVAVFLYGREKTGFTNHAALQNWPRYGVAKTIEPVYELRLTPSGEPLAFKQPHSPAAANLQGELYIVEPDILFALDAEFENTVSTRRFQRDFLYHPPEEKDKNDKKWKVAKAFMYVAANNHWGGKNLTLLTLNRPQNGGPAYYVYTKQDEQAWASCNAF